MVSNNPNNSYLYACDGDKNNPAKCFRYTIANGVWVEMDSLPNMWTSGGTYDEWYALTCAFVNNYLYAYTWEKEYVYKLDTTDIYTNVFEATTISPDYNYVTSEVSRMAAVVVQNTYMFWIGQSDGDSDTFQINSNTDTAVQEPTFPLRVTGGQGVYASRSQRIYYLGFVQYTTPQSTILYAGFTLSDPFNLQDNHQPNHQPHHQPNRQ